MGALWIIAGEGQSGGCWPIQIERVEVEIEERDTTPSTYQARMLRFSPLRPRQAYLLHAEHVWRTWIGVPWHL